MKQAHFVVVIEENGNAFIDYETAMNVLPDGAVYDPGNGDYGWESEFDHAGFYESASEKLGDLLRQASFGRLDN